VDYFPAFLDLRARPCLLIGGGPIAVRKARLLASAGAQLTIIAPRVTEPLETLARTRQFAVHRRVFAAGDVDGQWLVVSATGDPAVDSAVYAAATNARVFCNSVDDRHNTSYITPAIVDRGGLVVAISSGGAAPVLARKVREQIESLLPYGMTHLVQLAGHWRTKVIASISSVLGRRRYWEEIFDGPIAELAISGDIAAAESGMADLLESTSNSPPGQAWLVGAGPGDPGLLTLRALQVLQKVDVIVYDRLVSNEVLALARRDVDLISVGKAPGCKANSQKEINQLLVSLLAAGKRVCRLKGGDPFVFGRGGEERDALYVAGYSCEIVPGITAAAACAASAGIPLTHRGVAQSVVLVTAHGQDSVDELDWPSLARSRQTLAFYMAVRRFAELMNQLIDHGLASDTPIAIIEKGTTREQRVLRGNLGQLTLLAAAHKVAAPAILIVGAVAALGADTVLPSPQNLHNYATHSHSIAEQGQ